MCIRDRIYGAALRAGMTITLRDCHSSPSTYVPIGLDATVSYGEIDFQFRNDLDTPVYIMSWMDGVTPVSYTHLRIASTAAQTTRPARRFARRSWRI